MYSVIVGCLRIKFYRNNIKNYKSKTVVNHNHKLSQPLRPYPVRVVWCFRFRVLCYEQITFLTARAAAVNWLYNRKLYGLTTITIIALIKLVIIKQ